MPIVRIVPIGAGVAGDSRRVHLPTWSLVREDAATGTWLVDVSDADLPEALRGADLDMRTITRQQLAAFVEHLNTRYQEHRDGFLHADRARLGV